MIYSILLILFLSLIMAKPTVLISSTIYGIEELRDRIYTLLTNFGYEVWCSHKGTVPVKSELTAFENCLESVQRCDLFLGIVTPFYGTGLDGTDISITHQEIQKAIELKKPRWLLVHDHVVFARTLLRDLGHKNKVDRAKLELSKHSKVLSDLRVIDMYDEAILDGVPLDERVGNWVQKFNTNEDAMLFATAQFSRFQEVEAFIKENLKNISAVTSKIPTLGVKV